MKTLLSLDSTDGKITDPEIMLNKAFDYFVASDYSQSTEFKEEVSSFKYIFLNNSTNPDNFKSELNNTLDKMLKRYFKEVEIETEVSSIDNSSSVNFNISITVKDENGKIGSLNKSAVLNVLNLENIIFELN